MVQTDAFTPSLSVGRFENAVFPVCAGFAD
jgi:hypothetical protein